ncbi:retrovirus-related pol polyprotein from transposon TNT 1-94 [Tanacetum coccineum]
MKFLNKYCPPARTAKKMEEINNFQQEPDESLFRALKRFKELLMKCTQHYLTDMQEVILFYNGLNVPTRQILNSKGVIPIKIAADAKAAIQEMAENSQKWHNRTSSKSRRQYIAAGPGFYQRKNGNSSYPNRRLTLEESLAKFMVKSAKRHEDNSNIIKKIRDSTNAAIRNQGASIKTLEIQIGQMSKIRTIRPLIDLGASVSVMPFSTYSNLVLGDLAPTRLTIELADRTIKHPRGIAENVLVRIDVFKRKITLRVGEEKRVFKSIKPATSIIRRVYMLKGRMDLGSKTEFVGEAINESFDPLYGNYIELNDLDMPLEPIMNQDDFEPTSNFVNEPAYKSCCKMKFSCIIGYRHINDDFILSLSINIMTKRFYNSIIKDNGDHEGKNLARTLIDIPIFVEIFSIISGF